MRTKITVVLLFATILSLWASTGTSAQGSADPWTPQQLLNPAALAKVLNNPKAPQPYLFCVGPQAVIKGSIDIGPTRTPANLAQLKLRLTKLPKTAQIVVYCGCCPFDRCPNVRPAMALLKQMHFNNYKLLNLPQNVKVDWIDHGYPMIE